MLYYVDDFLYWCTSEELEKWFVDTLGKRFHVKFLGYENWFKDDYISVDQDIYATSVVAKYLETL